MRVASFDRIDRALTVAPRRDSVEGRIGGDSLLTAAGLQFKDRLRAFAVQYFDANAAEIRVRRARRRVRRAAQAAAARSRCTT